VWQDATARKSDRPSLRQASKVLFVRPALRRSVSLGCARARDARGAVSPQFWVLGPLTRDLAARPGRYLSVLCTRLLVVVLRTFPAVVSRAAICGLALFWFRRDDLMSNWMLRPTPGPSGRWSSDGQLLGGKFYCPGTISPRGFVVGGGLSDPCAGGAAAIMRVLTSP